jgi:hypothetical protein
VIGADIAARLAAAGSAFWSAEVEINERRSVIGDWIVASRYIPGYTVPSDEFARPWQSEQTRITGVSVIRIVDVDEVSEMKAEWMESREELGPDHPFGIAVVRHTRQAELTELGCIVGDRFPAPVSFAVAAAQAHRRRD